jgi:WD40 repeat protein
VAALESDGTWTHLIDAAVTDLVAIPDGGMATTAADGWVRTWDDAGSPTGRFSSGSTSLVSLAATPDGRRVVAGGADGRVHVWTTDDGGSAPHMSFRGASRGVTALAIDPSGERVAGVDAAGMAFIWDTRDVLPGEFGSWPAHGAVAVSPDGGLLAVTEPDGQQVTARTLPEGDVVATMTVPDTDGVVTPIVGLTFSASGTDIVATTWGAGGHERVMLQAWDAQSGRVTASENGDVPVDGAAAVAADGREIAIPTCNDLVSSGHAPTVLETSAGVTVRTTWGCWRAVDLSDDGTAVAAQTALGEVTVWDVASLRGQGWLGLPAPRILTVHHTPATTGSVAFSPDETALLTAGVDGTARVWAVPSGETLLVLDAGGGPVESARWTADGSRIVTSSHDGVPRLWDAQSGALLAELPAHDTWPHLAVTPDGARLLTSADGVVRVWTLNTDELTAIAESAVGRVLTGAERTRYDIGN